MPTKIEKDSLSGQNTTGHEWDGLKELNTPLPKWWLWTFYACIAFSLVWVVIYPALPIPGATGTSGWIAREAVVRDVQEAEARMAPMMNRLRAATPAQIAAARDTVNHIHIDPAIRKYIVQIIHTTRFPSLVDAGLKNLVRAGASPRGTINLALTARALAFMNGRGFVTPQDVKDMAADVLRHRILLSYEAEAEEVSADSIIERIMSKVPVP